MINKENDNSYEVRVISKMNGHPLRGASLREAKTLTGRKTKNLLPAKGLVKMTQHERPYELEKR